MTKFKKTNKLPVEQILVVRGDVAFPTGTFATSTSALNLTNGGLGVLSWDFDSPTKTLGRYIASTDDSNEVTAIKIVNGTPKSSNVTLADIFEADDTAYLQSGVIRKENIRSVAVKRAAFGQWGAQYLEGVDTPQNNLEYKAYLRLLSVRKDRYYGDNDEVLHSIVPAKDFTTDGTTSRLDWVMQKLAAGFNVQSQLVKGNKTFAILGIRSTPTVTPPTAPTITLTGGVITGVSGGTGGSGYTVAPTVTLSGGSPSTAGSVVAIINNAGAITGYQIVSGGAGYGSAPTAALSGGAGTVIGTLTPGTSVPFFRHNGTTYSFVADHACLQALADLVNQSPTLAGSATIEVIDSTTAGQMLRCDSLVVLGLPHARKIAYDDVEQVMVNPELNLGPNFTALTPVVYNSAAREGTGQGWKWQIQWRHRAGLDVHTKQIKPNGDWFVEGKSYINEDKMYTSYAIEYYDTEDTLTGTVVSPKTCIILFPAEVQSGFTVNVNNIVTRLAAGNTPIPIIASNDAGTGTASANAVPNTNAILSAWLEHVRTTSNSFRLVGDATSGSYLS